MKLEQEKRQLDLAMEELETNFIKNKRKFEEQIEELDYGQRQANQVLDELGDAARYYLHKFEVEEAEVHTAMSIIEENRENLLGKLRKEQQELDILFEEKITEYRKKQEQLESQRLQIRSEER